MTPSCVGSRTDEEQACGRAQGVHKEWVRERLNTACEYVALSPAEQRDYVWPPLPTLAQRDTHRAQRVSEDECAWLLRLGDTRQAARRRVAWRPTQEPATAPGNPPRLDVISEVARTAQSAARRVAT